MSTELGLNWNWEKITDQVTTYILHIETATKVCSVALSGNGELLALKESSDENYSHGENLTLFIQDVLNHAGIKPVELSAISVASGPGSYTGLRIGVSTAKGMCYALGIPLISVDALISLANLAKKKHPHLNLCALIDARRMEVYNCLYDSELKPLKSISADIIEADSYSEFEPFVYFGDGSMKLQEIWRDRVVNFDSEIQSSAEGQIKLAYEKYNLEQFEDLAYFEPFYLKEFVVLKKKNE